MKKILIITLLFLCLVGCGQKTVDDNTTVEQTTNTIASLIDEGYTYECSSFDDQQWRGLFSSGDKYSIIEAKMTAELYSEADEVFFEDDKYEEFIKKLEIIKNTDISDRIPTLDDLQKYVGQSFGDIEDEGFEQTGYYADDNNQYNFYYENDTFYMVVKGDQIIEDMDDYSANDLRNIKIVEVVDYAVSSNVLDY